MATVYKLLKNPQDFVNDLQKQVAISEDDRRKWLVATIFWQRMTRGILIRKYIAFLHHNAIIIQCAFRQYLARQAYREALKIAVKLKHWKYYNENARKIQAAWAGYWSRKIKFDYYAYRKWLAVVTERAKKKTYEATSFGVQSRTDSLKILEAEARQWLAYVVFRLHHLMRTYGCAGVYSDAGTNELSQFEQLLNSIRYKDFMVKRKEKYDEYVKKNKPKFNNKRLFPIIGEGKEYWYLTLPEMYDLTAPVSEPKNTRHVATHHGPIHDRPFLWKNVRMPCGAAGRSHVGPFVPRIQVKIPPCVCGDQAAASSIKPIKDPRFHLYVKHYKPDPEVFDYIDFHINLLAMRRDEMHNLNYPCDEEKKKKK